MTFLIILEVLLTTWNSDYGVPFWQYHYGLTGTLTSSTIQTDLSRVNGWMVTLLYTLRNLNAERDNKCMYDRGYSLNFYLSWILLVFHLCNVLTTWTCSFLVAWRETMFLVAWRETMFLVAWRETMFLVAWRETVFLVAWRETMFLVAWRESVLGCLTRNNVLGCLTQNNVLGCLTQNNVLGCLMRNNKQPF